MPTDVEKIMMTHPAIMDVGVVGLPDVVDGEHPMAFVVLSPGQNATADELIAYTNGETCSHTVYDTRLLKRYISMFCFTFSHLAKVMDEEKLRGGIRFIDKIPRNDLGKIIRPELMNLLKI